MLKHLPHRTIIIGVVWLFILILILSFTGYIQRFPQTHPDKTLEIEEKVLNFFQAITLPLKIAKLGALEPDKEILMPVHGHRISEISDTWQAPRGEGRVHEGQDIFATRGTPVFSATKGHVLRITED